MQIALHYLLSFYCIILLNFLLHFLEVPLCSVVQCIYQSDVVHIWS